MMEWVRRAAYDHLGIGGACGVKSALCDGCRFYGAYDPSNDRILCDKGRLQYTAFVWGIEAYQARIDGIKAEVVGCSKRRTLAEDAKNSLALACTGKGYNQRKGWEDCVHRDECPRYQYYCCGGYQRGMQLVQYRRIVEFRGCLYYKEKK